MLLILVAAPILLAEDVKTYYPSGKVQMEVTGDTMRQYYENGQVLSESRQNQNGDPIGIGKMFHENGQVMREDDYEKKTWKQFLPDGTLMMEGKME